MSKNTMKRKKETPEQVAERMAKLRAKRKPAQYKNIHPTVLALPDDHNYSFKNIKEWIKEAKDQVSAFNKTARSRGLTPQEKQKASNAADNKKAYIRYMEHYLKHGDWISEYSGKNEEHRVIPRCVAMAYDSNGNPKRTVGVYYPDIHAVWTREMERQPIQSDIAITDKQFTSK